MSEHPDAPLQQEQIPTGSPTEAEQEEQQSAGQLILSNADRPTQLYILPVHSRPFMPAQLMPLSLPAEYWAETLERVMKTPHQMVSLFFVDNFEAGESLSQHQLPKTGTLTRIHKVQRDDDRIRFFVEGVTRVRIKGLLQNKAPFLAEVEYPEAPEENADELRAWALTVISAIKELLPINPLYGEEVKQYISRFSPNDPGPLTDFAAAITTADGNSLQGILDCVPLIKRMDRTLSLLKREIEVAQMHSQISQAVNERVDKHQRDFFLREQLKVIQKELGISKDDKTADLDRYQEMLQGKTLSPQAEEKINEELNKLSVLEPGSPEYGVTRNWLDWACSLPWGIQGKDRLDIKRARQILDKEHAGLEDVKSRILEFLAVAKFKGEIKGALLLLVGPPGVGKTSIGRSIAETLNRPFYRFSLGGMRDEAEIKGHTRTYIGALPGKLVQALKEVKQMNPVIMLDEIDKLGHSHQGDPASALLETLDPEQNHNFLDHYLDLRLDLSQVLFVATANTLDGIPAPLLDRMEVIRLSGYLAEEKMAIASKHLWPKLLKQHGAKSSQIRLSKAALKEVIQGYARESGVRNLEKKLSTLMRNAIVQLTSEGLEQITISKAQAQEWLGSALFRPQKPQQGIGIVNGLAWTSMGGTSLGIEAALVHQQQAGLKLTGQLGDVMQESAQIALNFLRAQAADFGLDAELLNKAFIHLHVPEGATPKDGPSAGITMASALLSLLSKQPLKANLAMTGELTLTGQVLPVGGIREKIVAAKRIGIEQIILPKANEQDFAELPDYVKEGVEVFFAEQFAQVAKRLF